MTITGGVVDQRVFGQYGPGAPAQILGDLLEGTGSNMILRETASAAPAELILTPRQGGVTPPNPNASGFDDGNAPRNNVISQPPPYPDQIPPGPHPPRQPYAPSPDGYGISPAAVVPPPGSAIPNGTPSNPASPNGVLTPEQIYQQLQQLQRAQPQQ